MRDWVATVETSHYLLGSVMGPHPYPWMVRELHRVIGDEAREQCRALLGRDPDVVTACVGGGSNAIGLFSGFAELPDVELVGVEPAGGAAVGHGVPGIVHGSKSYLLQDEHGQVRGGRVDLGRPRLPGHRARSTPTSPRSAGPATRRSPTPRCSTPSRSLARTEGIIPRPRVRPRAGLGAAGQGRAGRQGRDPQPVGPGRQGRGPGRRHPRAGRRWLTSAPLEAHLRDAARRRPQAARPLRHRRARRRLDRGRAGLRRRRRRRHRGRHPVLRPGDGRPHDPGGLRGRARRRAPTSARSSTSCATSTPACRSS